MIEFEILNRFTGATQATVEIDCADLTPYSQKLGIAVIKAIKEGFDLSGANLSEVNLSEADLSRVNLSEVDFYRADLSGANLSDADLSQADLIGADLSGVNLSGVNLSGVNLSRVNLSGANLSGADLSRARFKKGIREGRETMHSLKITKETNFAQVNDFQKKTDIILRKYGIDAEAAIRVDYGDTIHVEGNRVFVEKG